MDKKKIEEITKDIDKAIGEGGSDAFSSILKFVQTQLKTDERLEEVVVSLDSMIGELGELKKSEEEKLEKLLERLEELKPPKFPEELKVSNLDEINEVKVKEPSWLNTLTKGEWQGLLDKVSKDVSKQIRQSPLEVDLDRYLNPNRPLAVRLSTGSKFYTAIGRAMVAAGGGIPFKTAGGEVLEGLVDSQGHLQVDILSGAGAGTQYAVDDALGATPTGTLALAKRDDALSALTPVEGDAVPLRTDSQGALWVKDVGIDAALSGSELQVDIVAITPDLMLGTDFSSVFGAASVVSATPAVKVEEQGTVTVQATNLDIRDLVETQDAVAIYGSDDGGTTKRIIKTDAGGAIQVDLEVASVAITSFPDNEPFDLAQYGGGAVGAANAIHVQPGTGAVFTADVTGQGDVPITLDGEVVTVDLGANNDVTTEIETADLDTGAGVDTQGVVGLLYGASGGGVLVTQANPLPVDLRADNLGGNLDINIAADAVGLAQESGGNLATIAGAVAGSEMQVDIVTAPTITVSDDGSFAVDTELTTDDLDTGVGTDTRAVVGLVLAESGGGVLVGSANPLPISHAALTELAAAIDTEVQVDIVSSALPAGAATAANQSTIIGHVDGIEGLLGTIDVDTGNIATSLAALDNAVDGNYLNVNMNIAGTDVVGGAGAVAAGVQRVTLASDDPAVTDLAAIETLLTGIDSDTNTLQGAVAGGQMQVDVVASLPAGDNNIGNVDIVTLPGTVESDIGDIETNTDFGALFPTASTDWKYADINDAVSGNNTIIGAQGAGNKIAVWAVMVVSDGTVDVRFEDGAGGTAFTGQIPLQAREGFTYSGGIVPLWVGSANTLLNLELSAAVNVHGHVAYTVVT